MITIDKYRTDWSNIWNYSPAVGHTTIGAILNAAIAAADADDFFTSGDILRRIRSRCGCFKPLYPYSTTEELSYFHDEMANWANNLKYSWIQLFIAYVTEYNPLENYDRTRHETVVLEGASTTDTTTTAHVAPDSEETYYNTGKSVVDNDTTTDNTTTTDSRDHGNVGVTTSQQMLQSELDLRSTAFIDKYFVEPFVREFAIAVY